MSCVGLLWLLAGSCQVTADGPGFATLCVSDGVGDIIDASERDSLGLFPGVRGFASVRFATGPNSEPYAFVDCDRPEGRTSVPLRLSSNQLERIRFLAGNAESVRRDTSLNPYAGLALRRFWSGVELAGSFGGYVPTQLPGEAGTTPAWQEKSCGALRGATAGAAVGGCIASWTAARRVTAGSYEEHEVACGLGTFEFSTWTPPVYHVNYPLYCGISGGAALLGGAGGLAMPRADEGSGEAYGAPPTGWRAGLTACFATIPGAALGALFAWWAHKSLYGREGHRYTVENESDWRAVPVIAGGVCIAVEFAVLGYKLGRSWEQARVRRTARTGYALNRRLAGPDTAFAPSP